MNGKKDRTMKRSRFDGQFTALLCLSLLLLASVSCSRKKPEPTAEDLKNNEIVQVPLVQLCEVQLDQEFQPQTFSGVAKEGRTTKLAFRVPGPMVSLTAKVGSIVEAGAELARLDQRDYESTIAVVDAGIAEVQAGIDAKKANMSRSIEMLQKQLDAAAAQFNTADKNLTRFEELAKNGSVPDIKLDEVKLQHEQALAAKVAAEKQLENGQKGLAEEIKSLEAKQAGLIAEKKKATDALEDTVLCAPCRGFVAQKYAEEGEIAAPGIPILAFTDVSEILVQTTIPESLVVRQKEFASFQCRFEIYPDQVFDAKLDSLGKALLSGGHGYPLEVKIQNDTDCVLYPGMAASVTINFKPHDGECFVPLMAVVGDYEAAPSASDPDPKEYDGKSRQSVVWKVSKENKITKHPVQIVRLSDEGVVITGDVQPGDHIVGLGARFLREGQTVRLR